MPGLLVESPRGESPRGVELAEAGEERPAPSAAAPTDPLALPAFSFTSTRRSAGAPPRSAPAGPATGERPGESSLLDDLRRRMDAILTRTRAEGPRPPPRVDISELPFCVEDTPQGPLHVRTLRLSGAHRVGRAPITAAKTADTSLLALLALDPSIAACSLDGALYLDTETTGLGPGAGTVAFLIGLAFHDGVGLVVEQLLVRQLGEEAPVLARVAERIRAASMLITFNGKSFDLPVLRTRFVMGRMAMPPEPPHLDLVHVARRLHKARGIGATLGVVEREVLGFVRENDVPSGEVCACYLHFLRTGDAGALMGVVEHNAWDVVSMAAIVGLYGEPLDGSQLSADDLVGVARTLKRAGAVDRALEVADAAVARGARNAEGHRARAEIAKARGDKALALADFETLSASVDDPKVRLELAKLYEHHAKDAIRAMAMVEAGTGEAEPQVLRRADRLRRKLEKASGSPTSLSADALPAGEPAPLAGRTRRRRSRAAAPPSDDEALPLLLPAVPHKL